MTRLFEKEYGLPVNSNPTDPRSRVRTFRMAALFSDHRFTSAQIALLEQVRWSNAYIRPTPSGFTRMFVTRAQTEKHSAKCARFGNTFCLFMYFASSKRSRYSVGWTGWHL